MTPSDIDKLEAGRELDALIAEKVMGWKPRTQAEYNDTFKLTGGTLDAPMQYLEWSTLLLKPYSTSISAAWEVVEKLVERDINIKIIRAGRPQRWLVNFMHNVRSFKPIEAPTAPLAICRAALKVIEVKNAPTPL